MEKEKRTEGVSRPSPCSINEVIRPSYTRQVTPYVQAGNIASVIPRSLPRPPPSTVFHSKRTRDSSPRVIKVRQRKDERDVFGDRLTTYVSPTRNN